MGLEILADIGRYDDEGKRKGRERRTRCQDGAPLVVGALVRVVVRHFGLGGGTEEGTEEGDCGHRCAEEGRARKCVQAGRCEGSSGGGVCESVERAEERWDGGKAHRVYSRYGVLIEETKS